MKQCIGGNGSLRHVILMFSVHEEVAVRVRAIVFCVFLEEDFGFSSTMKELNTAVTSVRSPPPMHDEFMSFKVLKCVWRLFATDSGTCSFCSYKVSHLPPLLPQRWNHNSPFHSKGRSKPSKDLASGDTLICSQITRQKWFEDAVNYWQDKEEELVLPLRLHKYLCCALDDAAWEHWNDLESLRFGTDHPLLK